MPFSFNQGQQNQTTEVANSSFEKKKDEGPDFIVLILLAVFIILLLVTAGLFAYKSNLEKSIESKKADLSKYEGSLKGVPLEDIKSISSKLKVTSQLVRDHPFITTILKITELSVEDSITYTSFDLNVDDRTNGYKLTLNAISKDYTSIYQQAETLKRAPYSKYISKVEISPLKLPDDKGNIKFTITMNVAIKGILPDSVVVEDSTNNESQKQTVDTNASTTIDGVPPANN